MVLYPSAGQSIFYCKGIDQIIEGNNLVRDLKIELSK